MERLQNELWMKRSTSEGAEFMFGMFATARRFMIDSLPKDLSDKERKRQIYFRTYGEPLPEDFFKD
jgi:hypothetical protein